MINWQSVSILLCVVVNLLRVTSGWLTVPHTGSPFLWRIHRNRLLQPLGRNSRGTRKVSAQAVGAESSGNLVEIDSQLKQVRLHKLALLQQNGIEPFSENYHLTHKTLDLHSLYQKLPNGEEDASQEVSIAGRIMIRRFFGKLAFFQLQDDVGHIQIYIQKGRLGEDSFNLLRDASDAGDILGVKGTMKRTEKGELSIYLSSWRMLSKCLATLPDKFHGFTDVNKRYRQRYLDFLVNPPVRQVFLTRSRLISQIRSFLDRRDFLEMETPVLTTTTGGAEARPFTTLHHSLNMSLSLRIATELHLKRLVVGGFHRVYEIGRIFRNEGLSPRHNPEFTSLELYQAFACYEDMMSLAEDLIWELAQTINSSTSSASGNLVYQNQTIDLSRPFRRVSMTEIVKENTGLDFYPLIARTYSSDDTKQPQREGEGEEESALEEAKEMAMTVRPAIPPDLLEETETVGEVLNLVFEEYCEKTLIQPTFVTDHPIDISPLAKRHPNHHHHQKDQTKKGLTERFELFIAGKELANAFSELTDPIEQRQRFLAQVEKRKKKGRNTKGMEGEDAEVDEDFLNALEMGMPPTAGMGIGIDRLVMLFTNSPSIKDVIAFPLLKKER